MAERSDWTFTPTDFRPREERTAEARKEAKAREREARKAQLERDRREQANLTQADDARTAELVARERERLEVSITANLAEQATECRDGARRNALRNLERSLVQFPPAETATAEQRTQRGQVEREALAAFRRSREWDEFSAELRSVSVGAEPPIYGPHSEHSYFRDRTLAASDNVRERVRKPALERLAASDRREIRENPERVTRALRDMSRQEITFIQQSRDQFEELRTGMTSGSGSGGAFQTPAYLLDDYATWREFAPVFAEQGCTNKPLPPFGLKVYVPTFTAGVDAGKQSAEGAGISEVDATGALQEGDIATLESVILASQQLVDRVGPGHNFDEFIFAQAMQELDQKWDAAVIAAALTGVTPNSRGSAFTANEVAAAYGSDLGQMASSLETTAGVKLPPQCQFTAPTFGEWLIAQTDAQSRPLFPYVGGQSRTDGFTGFAPGAVPLFLDGNLVSGGNAQVIVTNRASVYVYVGDPLFQIFPESAAEDLQAVVRAYRYFAVVQRYPGGVAETTGAAYSNTVTWS